jgi:ribosomal protein L37AE/L43A
MEVIKMTKQSNMIFNKAHKPYIVTCPSCSGKGSVKKNNSIIKCKDCKGLGVVSYHKDYLMFKVMDDTRNINFLWEVLQHKKPIPEKYIWDLKHNSSKCTKYNCPKCNGDGTINIFNSRHVRQEVTCPMCKGRGFTKAALKKMFKGVFDDFVKFRRERNLFEDLLKTQSWKNPDIKGLSLLKPSKPRVVCTRCTFYLIEDDENRKTPCSECCNGANRDAKSMFKPITERAAKWYKTDGYKYNYHSKTLS